MVDEWKLCLFICRALHRVSQKKYATQAPESAEVVLTNGSLRGDHLPHSSGYCRGPIVENGLSPSRRIVTVSWHGQCVFLRHFWRTWRSCSSITESGSTEYTHTRWATKDHSSLLSPCLPSAVFSASSSYKRRDITQKWIVNPNGTITY